jgi:ABC-type polar amino acid transport system ATPase subunit
VIEIKGLKKRFNKHQVLKGIDLSVAEGETVGLIGVSGSGKSTFLRCLNFLEAPDEGSIRLGERSIDVSAAKKDDILYLRRNTSMVFQLFNLFKYKTALENVIEGLVVVKKMPPAEARAVGEDLLVRVGLHDRMHYYPSKLSGGQQQRVAIARAMSMNPKVLLLDEPTSALDPELIAEVLSVIRRIAKEGQTMIIVSHEMNFIYDISDKVIFLDEGSVLERGTPREVFHAPQSERARQFLSRVSLANDYTI